MSTSAFEVSQLIGVEVSSATIVSSPTIAVESNEQKLDKIYGILNHIRWIGLSIAIMFALTFVIPNL